MVCRSINGKSRIMTKYMLASLLAISHLANAVDLGRNAENWRIDTTEQWRQAEDKSDGFEYMDGRALPSGAKAFYRSVTRTFDEKCSAKSIIFTQSPEWHNWEPVGKIAPQNLGDAPVFLVKGKDDYWLFGTDDTWLPGFKDKAFRARLKEFKPEVATLKGFDIPLQTTLFPNVFTAPGGLKKDLGGFHAWQSRDMVNWVHHGPVTKLISKWVTTAEYVDGKTYIYYDFPNDQDPHLYIDEDLTDGVPGKNMGLAFKDPSHGSDCTFIRDLKGNFHVIYEDWSPLHPGKNHYDSPLAGHAVSPNGIGNFKILPPAVDARTTPTGEIREYSHPHWHYEDPNNFPVPDNAIRGTLGKLARGKYEVHEPAQDAYGDWAAISIGGQYYLFADYHSPGSGIRIGWFTSSSLDEPFKLCVEIGEGHPDPDIGFAQGRFYLITQIQTDYVSPGPWVEKVEARVGVDTDKDGEVDTWTDWQQVKERYDYIEGFAKQVKRIAASLDIGGLPAGYGFCFEFRTEDTTQNRSQPILDSVDIAFKR